MNSQDTLESRDVNGEINQPSHRTFSINIKFSESMVIVISVVKSPEPNKVVKKLSTGSFMLSFLTQY